ncbi:DUF5689 domain-containing protein [uncultured Aquimarina sp.]|uniref:DUF5689 domain-containing protein n=1 Tax=uncultured Aquimarina sp. TaxID=575652 RepID=UPI0026052521|nr:DUF5689 domain-containing protein [uncultured Aquimarina sp.]
MNLNIIKKIISVLVLVVMFTACVQDDNFQTPVLEIREPNIASERILGVDAVVEAIAQAGDDPINYEDSDKFMSGYVVSSDRAGNFFEELVIQDKAENPTAGIRILIDVNPLFTSYEFGRRVFIKLEGLSGGIENGVASLGILSGNEVGQIPSFSQEEIIIRSAEVATITPLEIAIADFSDVLINLYVRINNVQFNRTEVLGEDGPLTFAGERGDSFDGERILESCDDGAIAILSTSTFSDFKSLSLPIQQGSFEGILTKNFFGDTFNLVLNNSTGLVFDNEIRCDPTILSCENTSISGETIVYEENFDLISNTNDLEEAGYTTVNISGGNTTFGSSSFGNNSRGVSISAFRTRENPLIAWLITPEINLNNSTDETLTFEIAAGFDRGLILEVFITENYTDDPITTSWFLLENANIPIGPTNGFGNFESAGSLDISCLSDTVRIGFKYSGGDSSGRTTSYNIDNIKVLGN